VFNIFQLTEFAGPVSVGQLPGSMFGRSCQSIQGDFLEPLFQRTISTGDKAQRLKRLDEGSDRLLPSSP